MFLYSLFLARTAAFYRQDTVQPQIEPVYYINYAFSRWQIRSCLPAPGGQKTDADGGRNVGFGFNLVSSNKHSFGFNL